MTGLEIRHVTFRFLPVQTGAPPPHACAASGVPGQARGDGEGNCVDACGLVRVSYAMIAGSADVGKLGVAGCAEARPPAMTGGCLRRCGWLRPGFGRAARRRSRDKSRHSGHDKIAAIVKLQPQVEAIPLYPKGLGKRCANHIRPVHLMVDRILQGMLEPASRVGIDPARENIERQQFPIGKEPTAQH